MNHAIPTLDQVIRHIHDLPSLPAVVAELLASMEQDDIDTRLLAEKITRDQALTAKTLRLANSSFYGMSSRVTSIEQAIAVLGFHSIRTLVTACSVVGSLAGGPAAGFDFATFWRHSVATALAAKALARRLGQNADTAFTAGLLHDLGTLVLATRFPGQYAHCQDYRRQHDCQVVEAERAVFGLDHAAVGSALATHWKFPAAIGAAVARHHALPEQVTLSLDLTVHLANAVAHALDLSGLADDLVPPLAPALWKCVALSEQSWFDVFDETEAGFEEMSQVLSG